MRIWISPGHGGEDSGAIGPSGFMEKDYSLQQAQLAKLALSRAGHDVTLARHTDVNLVESNTCTRANADGADLMLSLHANGFSDPSASGCEVLYWNTSTSGRQLAEALLDSMASRFPDLTIRGAKPKFTGDRGETILGKTIMTSILLESAFITNPEEEEMLKDFVNQALIADAIRETVDHV